MKNTTPSLLGVALALSMPMLASLPIAHSATPSLATIKRPIVVQPQQANGDAFDSFVVTYKKTARIKHAVHALAMKDVGQRLGIAISDKGELATGAHVIRVNRKLDKAAIKRLANEIMRDPNVRAVEPNIRFYHASVPNDPLFSQQWHYGGRPGGVEVEQAWNVGDGAGVVVAVIDTGSTPHRDLAGQFVPGYDFISDAGVSRDGDARDANPNDEGDWQEWECGFPSSSSWHGTHVSGTIAAATNNGVGVAGVAPGARVQPIRAIGKCGGSLQDIADAIVWASGGNVPGVPTNQTPAEVINLSLGGGGACSIALQDAVDTAIANGSILVVAAGNSAADASEFQPASCNGVVSVAASTKAGTLAAYSNFGSIVSVAAPGGVGVGPYQDNVLSTINDGQTVQGADAFTWSAGTSMAAPHVAGIVALMQSVAPQPLSASKAKTILENTAYAVNGHIAECAGRYLRCGAGIVNAPMAVAVAAGRSPLPPTPPGPPPPPPPIELRNGVTISGITVAEGRDIEYYMDVPAGSTQVRFTMAGGRGDADLYVRAGQLPNDVDWDCRPWSDGNNESCAMDNPVAGRWYVRVKGFTAAQNVTLVGNLTLASGWSPPTQLVAPSVMSRNGVVRVALRWRPGASKKVDIRFNGATVATVRDSGWFMHSFSGTSGRASYQVCNAGTQSCSNTLQVTYAQRR